MKKYKPMHPRKRLLKIIKAFEELIADKEWWNENRTDCAPFDIGAQLVKLREAREALASWDSEDKSTFNRIVNKWAQE